MTDSDVLEDVITDADGVMHSVPIAPPAFLQENMGGEEAVKEMEDVADQAQAELLTVIAEYGMRIEQLEAGMLSLVERLQGLLPDPKADQKRAAVERINNLFRQNLITAEEANALALVNKI